MEGPSFFFVLEKAVMDLGGTDGCSGGGMTGSEACWEMKRREKLVWFGVVDGWAVRIPCLERL